MKILIAHNYYRQAGGEDSVVQAERELLSERGHEVRLFTADNDSISGELGKVMVACNAAYSERSKVRMTTDLAAFRPDLVHVHNFFPLLTPAIFDACHDVGVPVIQTLHNYRLICPGALLMRDGRICELCVRGSPYHSVLHRCYRGSYLGSVAVAHMVANHRNRGTWHDRVNIFIALTEFARSKFIEGGIPAGKIRIKPNFVSLSGKEQSGPLGGDTGARDGALFVGRLSEEKGLQTLLRAWENISMPLCLIGDGPLRQEVEKAKIGALTWMGKCSRDEVNLAMSRASFLVVGSECYEGFPLVIAEAYSNGLPVLASRLGAMAEIVVDGVTGLHFIPGDAKDLAQKATWLFNHPEECRRMGDNARQVFQEKYSAQKNYEMLMAIYKQAILPGERNSP